MRFLASLRKCGDTLAGHRENQNHENDSMLQKHVHDA